MHSSQSTRLLEILNAQIKQWLIQQPQRQVTFASSALGEFLCGRILAIWKSGGKLYWNSLGLVTGKIFKGKPKKFEWRCGCAGGILVQN